MMIKEKYLNDHKSRYKMEYFSKRGIGRLKGGFFRMTTK